MPRFALWHARECVSLRMPAAAVEQPLDLVFIRLCAAAGLRDLRLFDAQAELVERLPERFVLLTISKGKRDAPPVQRNRCVAIEYIAEWVLPARYPPGVVKEASGLQTAGNNNRLLRADMRKILGMGWQ